MQPDRHQIRNTAPIPSAGPKYFCQLSLNFFVSFILPILLPQFMHFPLLQAFSMNHEFLSLCLRHPRDWHPSLLQKFQQIRLLPASALHICPGFSRTASLPSPPVHLSGRFRKISPAESGCLQNRPDAHLTALQTIPCDKPRILKSANFQAPQDSGMAS